MCKDNGRVNLVGDEGQNVVGNYFLMVIFFMNR
jgi:hypothetical protein